MSYEIIAFLIFASLGLSFAFKVKTINIICAAGAVAFPLVMIMLGQSFADMGPQIIAGIAVFAIGYLLFVKGFVDGGVTKSAALAALWLPVQALPDVAIAVGLSIGGLALIATARKHTKVNGAAMALCAVTAGLFFLASPYGSERYQSQYAHSPAVTTSAQTASGDIPPLRLRAP